MNHHFFALGLACVLLGVSHSITAEPLTINALPATVCEGSYGISAVSSWLSLLRLRRIAFLIYQPNLPFDFRAEGLDSWAPIADSRIAPHSADDNESRQNLAPVYLYAYEF